MTASPCAAAVARVSVTVRPLIATLPTDVAVPAMVAAKAEAAGTDDWFSGWSKVSVSAAPFTDADDKAGAVSVWLVKLRENAAIPRPSCASSATAGLAGGEYETASDAPSATAVPSVRLSAVPLAEAALAVFDGVKLKADAASALAVFNAPLKLIETESPFTLPLDAVGKAPAIVNGCVSITASRRIESDESRSRLAFWAV